MDALAASDPTHPTPNNNNNNNANHRYHHRGSGEAGETGEGWLREGTAGGDEKKLRIEHHAGGAASTSATATDGSCQQEALINDFLLDLHDDGDAVSTEDRKTEPKAPEGGDVLMARSESASTQAREWEGKKENVGEDGSQERDEETQPKPVVIEEPENRGEDNLGGSLEDLSSHIADDLRDDEARGVFKHRSREAKSGSATVSGDGWDPVSTIQEVADSSGPSLFAAGPPMYANWPAVAACRNSVENLVRDVEQEARQAAARATTNAEKYNQRLQGILEEIAKLRDSHERTLAKREEKERENKEALTILEKEKETKEELNTGIGKTRLKHEELKNRITLLRERLRDPLHSFVPRGALALAVSAIAPKIDGDDGEPAHGTHSWWRLPRSVVESIFLFLPVREVTRFEGVCKAWTRLLGTTRTLRSLFHTRILEERIKRKRALKSTPRRQRSMEFDEHYVLNIEVGVADTYVVSVMKQSVPLSFLSPVESEDTGSPKQPDDEGKGAKSVRARPSIIMKPVIQRDKSKRSVRIMFTNHNFSGLKEEMAFVTEASHWNTKLQALRNRVDYLRKETSGDKNEAGRWYKKKIEETKRAVHEAQERMSSFRRQLDSDLATRRFLDETLSASEQSRRSLKEANVEMLQRGRKEIANKELELKQAEEAKVGQQKKLEELNTHIRILVTTAKSLKENITRLTQQRDQLKSELKNFVM